MTGMLEIDGAHGEGGGQILRTALSLSAITGRAIRIGRIRAGRRHPGLAAQHLTAVRAAAALCAATVSGAELESQEISFAPVTPAQPGRYVFDVGAAREGGSAGATTLVLQTVLLPLALAGGPSDLTIHGGTHMAWSPSFDYAAEVWLPALARLGIQARLELRVSGWYPLGKGEIGARIVGIGDRGGLRPLDVRERGELTGVAGRALAANLPAHIPQRMADRVRAMLAGLEAPVEVAPQRVRAACAGAGIFLRAEYEAIRCGFGALGAPGKPSEQVAEEAANALLWHRLSGAALDRHLGDQILLPLALASGRSVFTVEQVTRHLRTNAWVIEQFGLAEVAIETDAMGTGRVAIDPVPGAPGAVRRDLT